MSLNLYIIAGCNGAGKTTASFTILPEILNCREFVNADEIARGLSPYIDSITIERRYLQGIRNLFDIYLPIANEVLIIDNSKGKYKLIAEKSDNPDLIIYKKQKYNKLLKYYDSAGMERN